MTNIGLILQQSSCCLQGLGLFVISKIPETRNSSNHMLFLWTELSDVWYWVTWNSNIGSIGSCNVVHWDMPVENNIPPTFATSSNCSHTGSVNATAFQQWQLWHEQGHFRRDCIETLSAENEKWLWFGINNKQQTDSSGWN